MKNFIKILSVIVIAANMIISIIDSIKEIKNTLENEEENRIDGLSWEFFIKIYVNIWGD